MEKIEIVNFVNEASDLLQFDAREVLARLLNIPADYRMLNLPEDNLFPLPEGMRIRMAIMVQTIDPPLEE